MANPRKVTPMDESMDEATSEVRRKKRTDEALRRKKEERKSAARKRKHDKQTAAATKIQSLVRGAQTRVYISNSVAPEPQDEVSEEPSVVGELAHIADEEKPRGLSAHWTTPAHRRRDPSFVSASFRGYVVRKNKVAIAPADPDELPDDEVTAAAAPTDDNATPEDQPAWPEPLSLSEAIDVSHGTTEAVIAKGSVRVLVVTWNLQAQKPPADLAGLLRPGSCHIYAIGTEECVQTIAKSVLFQCKKEWEEHIRNALGPSDYIKLRSHALTAMHNMVFVHKSVLPLVSDLQSDAIATGLGNQLGNKGGVGIGFRLGRTRFAFVNCHFEAHQSAAALARRNTNFHRINTELLLLPSESEAKSQGRISEVFDRVFWSGDLNYRIDGTRRMIDTLLQRNLHNVLLANDQLTKERKANRVFENFQEGPLTFRPTYKFDKGCDVYDSSAKQRIPSWTDRILFMSRDPSAIHLHAYESHMDIKTSDHRPVSAIFDVTFDSYDDGKQNTTISDQTKSEVCTVQ
ncbi:inositol polyphosphate 5-phosphatase [Achlya hypogyna]|uniref:Inositol polyphosphate 5-phosphatase n=1 Tax=Achlya hypogyna TaxID=1202772 RepID=A0A1V9ZMR1_ACHHY|nr:inositol polyphosphate 5-phosphatase [Achlya hypogyna]